MNIDNSSEEVTIMGIVFHKMTDHERAPFLGAAFDAYTADVGKTILIYEPTGIQEAVTDEERRPRIWEYSWTDDDKEISREWILDEK